MRSIEPGISRFRIWSFGPSRNDSDALGDDGNDAVSLGEVAIRGYERPMLVWQLG
jgi:hypothetical protein